MSSETRGTLLYLLDFLTLLNIYFDPTNLKMFAKTYKWLIEAIFDFIIKNSCHFAKKMNKA